MREVNNNRLKIGDMKMKKQMNLAEGNVEKLVMRMAVPMVVAQLSVCCTIL